MSTVNRRIRDEALRNAIARERYSDDLAREILQILRRSEVDLEQQLAARIAKLGPLYAQQSGRATTERLADFLAATREINDAGYRDLAARLESELFGRARFEAVDAKREISGALAAVDVQLDLRTPPLPVLEGLVKNKPFDGRLLSEWVERTRDNRWAGIRDAVERTVGVGLAQGETVDQMARRLQGAFELSRREATSLVRTSVAHVAAESREAMYQANADIIKAEAWVSTLDTRTTGGCALRDGKLYDIKTKEPIGHDLPYDGGPGRRHWGCRATSVPVLGTWEDLGLDGSKIGPGARAAMDGEAAGNEDYEAWLKRQPLGVKKAALGDARGLAFDRGVSLADATSLPIARLLAGVGAAVEPTSLASILAGGVEVPRFSRVSEAEEWLETRRYAGSVYMGRISLEAMQDIADGVAAVMSAFGTSVTEIGKIAGTKYRESMGVYIYNPYSRSAGKILLRQRLDEAKNKRAGEWMTAQASKQLGFTPKRAFAMDDSRRPMFALAAHEAGHAIYYQSFAQSLWEARIRKAIDAGSVTLRDRVTVSLYAKTNLSELWAEVTALVADGRSSEVPESILGIYRGVVEAVMEQRRTN